MAQLISQILEELKAVQVAYESDRDNEAMQRVIDGYLQLLNEAPDDPEITFQLGTAYLQVGCYGAAMVYLHRVTDFWPDNYHVWSNLGCCYRSLHILPEARECFLKALMFDERAETYSNLASSYINEDNPAAGMPYAQKAMELAPDSAKGRWNAALLMLELGNWQAGFTLYDAGFFCNERQMRNYSNERPDSTPWWLGEAA